MALQAGLNAALGAFMPGNSPDNVANIDTTAQQRQLEGACPADVSSTSAPPAAAEPVKTASVEAAQTLPSSQVDTMSSPFSIVGTPSQTDPGVYHKFLQDY